ncbi:MAG: hypothetical protein SVV03_02135 [Candidatus Nanohaloarchaea archaeon]|nr:hypothetical protein [Candidatus Nanohaloarchaea archaeon]
MSRKGISFTLTIIIVAVLLLTAALTILTIFGSGISGISEVFSYSKEARIEKECKDIAREIQDNICDRYAAGGSERFQVQSNKDTKPAEDKTEKKNGKEEVVKEGDGDPKAEKTCNDMSCNIGPAASDGVVEYTYYYGAGVSSDSSIDTTITVEGETVNCFADNIIERKVCPVS